MAQKRVPERSLRGCWRAPNGNVLSDRRACRWVWPPSRSSHPLIALNHYACKHACMHLRSSCMTVDLTLFERLSSSNSLLYVLCVLCVVVSFSAVRGPRWRYITANISQAWPSIRVRVCMYVCTSAFCVYVSMYACMCLCTSDDCLC